MLKQSNEEREHAQKVKQGKLACTRNLASPSFLHPCPNLSLLEILADEVPESAWRTHCVGRHQGEQE